MDKVSLKTCRTCQYRDGTKCTWIGIEVKKNNSGCVGHTYKNSILKWMDSYLIQSLVVLVIAALAFRNEFAGYCFVIAGVIAILNARINTLEQGIVQCIVKSDPKYIKEKLGMKIIMEQEKDIVDWCIKLDTHTAEDGTQYHKFFNVSGRSLMDTVRNDVLVKFVHQCKKESFDLTGWEVVEMNFKDVRYPVLSCTLVAANKNEEKMLDLVYFISFENPLYVVSYSINNRGLPSKVHIIQWNVQNMKEPVKVQEERETANKVIHFKKEEGR
ncbi:MAG: hypothetical protein J6K43_06245 [Lachnospiraceae bacterium]|nr:hypothetical protein [Lachnospiraceae bacterium]